MAKFIPLYTTLGDLEAYYYNGHLFNLNAEWIGFVIPQTANVYSVLGYYVGRITQRGRILRRRTLETRALKQAVPPAPSKPRLPATAPLAPMFSEIDFGTVDVLDEMRDRLHPPDTGEWKEDMD